MPPKSNFRKRKKLKLLSQLKNPTRNWLELPSDLMLNILQKVDVVDRLENAQLVCTAWRKLCKDPAMWKVIYIGKKSNINPDLKTKLPEICKHAVDRSQGQLLDLTIIGFCDHALLHYVADRSSQLRRLEMLYYYGDQLSEALKKFLLLEELSLVRINFFQEDIEAVGRYCPLLKTLKVNLQRFSIQHEDNEVALAIGKNLPQLTHLGLIGNSMENIGLEAIMDGCCHLESLDLRGCEEVDLTGKLGKRCSQQIKHLKLPHDSLPHLRMIISYAITLK